MTSETVAHRFTHAVRFSISFKLKTGLMLRSGLSGDYTDSTIEKTQDGKLHINGYVWASLLRRALSRIKGAEVLASAIGDYDAIDGVSPLWCDATFAELRTATLPGIRIERKYGSTDKGGLFTDEIVPRGLSLNLQFNYFCANEDEVDIIKKNIAKALWVIDSGIENIGGGWGYGHGRLSYASGQYKKFDLAKNDLSGLWGDNNSGWTSIDTHERPEIADKKAWIKFSVKAAVADGQLLAIHTEFPWTGEGCPKDSPDKFVFRRMNHSTNNPEVIIPGKAIRQALLSVPIERKLRTNGNDICGTPSDKCTCEKCIAETNCKCLRCEWFGSTKKRGLIAVLDAVCANAETVTINRIQLCEHSAQNMNLFNAEYLKKGDFDLEILIDCARTGSDWQGLKNEVEGLLNGIKSGPPGWHRIGATSTCTGQIEIKSEKIECETYGPAMPENNNFENGFLNYAIEESVMTLTEDFTPNVWDDGYLAFSRGERRLSHAYTILNNNQWETLKNGQKIDPTNGVEGYLMEAGLWRAKDGVYEEVSIEREDDGFLIQRWTLRDKNNPPNKDAETYKDCYYRRVAVLARSAHPKNIVFSKGDLSAMEVVCQESRLHIFISVNGSAKK